MAKYQSTLTGQQMDAALAAMPDAEAYAKGTRNGQDVPSTDPTYHNNALYWAQQAQTAIPPGYDANGVVRGDISQTAQTDAWRARARANIGADWDLLWTNAAISSQFPQQTISLDLSQYNYVKAVCVATSSNAYAICDLEILRGKYGMVFYIISNKFSRREVEWGSNGVIFYAGQIMTSYGAWSDDNSLIIPYQIYAKA